MTGPNRYSYCKLYVAAGDRDAVTTLISEVVGAVASGHYVDVRSISFDILRNPDFGKKNQEEEFPFWPVVVEVTNAGGPASDMVEVIGELLQAFWADGKPAVAACPFEDELPWSGGIARIG